MRKVGLEGVDPASIPLPPSGIENDTTGDIASTAPKYYPEGFHFTEAAADSRGLWYFGRMSGTPSHLDDKRFEEERDRFTNVSFNAGFNMAAELPRLEQAYKQYLHAEVRFVPYEKIGSEAPCAGLHPSAEHHPASHVARAAPPAPHHSQPEVVKAPPMHNPEGVVTIDLSSKPTDVDFKYQ